MCAAAEYVLYIMFIFSSRASGFAAVFTSEHVSIMIGVASGNNNRWLHVLFIYSLQQHTLLQLGFLCSSICQLTKYLKFARSKNVFNAKLSKTLNDCSLSAVFSF